MSPPEAGRRSAPYKYFAHRAKSCRGTDSLRPAGEEDEGTHGAKGPHGRDPGGIVSGLRELGYTVELVP